MLLNTIPATHAVREARWTAIAIMGSIADVYFPSAALRDV